MYSRSSHPSKWNQSLKGFDPLLSGDAPVASPLHSSMPDLSYSFSLDSEEFSPIKKDTASPGSLIGEELKDLTISESDLGIPSLAKPSPTSFLTGKEEEVVRLTRGQEPAPYQMEIPSLQEFIQTARLIEFVENYRQVDQNFDLKQWIGLNRMGLQQVKIPKHIPIAESLIECGQEIMGVVSKGTNSEDRLEVIVFEGQRQLIAVFRGTSKLQFKAAKSTKRNKAVPLPDKSGVEVHQCYLEEYLKLEKDCFALLDRLAEKNPFCDVVFTGFSFGAAMSTLAAFRYTTARPMVRASCLTLASPKVGFSLLRAKVRTLPNLKVMRLELAHDGKCQLPATPSQHVGHTLVISKGGNKGVLAYRFDAPKHKRFFKTTANYELRSYVTALENVAKKKLPWAMDFVGFFGKGVVINNESRLVV